jgi:hypothetical protein
MFQGPNEKRYLVCWGTVLKLQGGWVIQSYRISFTTSKANRTLARSG